MILTICINQVQQTVPNNQVQSANGNQVKLNSLVNNQNTENTNKTVNQ